MILELPFPPSVNKYYRNVGGRMVISREGRTYRKTVCSLLRDRCDEPLDVGLEVSILLHAPDRRHYDVDNRLKGLLDSMEHAGVYVNDELIVKLTVEKRDPVRGGKTVVTITPKETS